MTYHQSSVVSVSIILTAATVGVLGYGVGRAHAAWSLARAARREVPTLRRIAWARTRGLVGGFLLLLAVLAVALDGIVR